MLVLALLEDIILNCLSLSVVLMRGNIVLLTGLSTSGTACQVTLLMLGAFLYLNTNYIEFVDFTPFVRVEFAQALCVSLFCYFLL